MQELPDQFALRTKKEKAAALISSWIDGNFLGENQAMEKLLHTAVLCPKISDLLANVASGKEADIVRSGSKEYVPEAVSLMTLHGACLLYTSWQLMMVSLALRYISSLTAPCSKRRWLMCNSISIINRSACLVLAFISNTKLSLLYYCLILWV